MTCATALSERELVQRIDQLASLSCVNAIVQPLMSYLQLPFEQQDMQRIIDLVSHDSSLTAQCLHMANSPLFGRSQAITSAKGAVIAIGLQRMRDIVLSCYVLRLMPSGLTNPNPAVFWEHSLACALLARRLAKRIGVRDPEQAYLAGLLHDLGFVVNLHVAPQAFLEVLRRAGNQQGDILQVERDILGFDHCDTGALLAERWELARPVLQTISLHHRPTTGSEHQGLVTLITFCDRICRHYRLGYGYAEQSSPQTDNVDIIDSLKAEWPLARTVDWPKLQTELVDYVADVRKLISVLFRLQ